MNDHRRRNENIDNRKSASKPAAEVTERRFTDRKPFIAEVRIVEESNSATRLAARSCDLAIHGCYVDTMNPFPVGTQVRVMLTKEGEVLDVKGGVVYHTPGLGMGIAFHHLTPGNLALLHKWLSSIDGEQEDWKAPFRTMPLKQPALTEVSPAESDDPLVRLVELLVRKGVLNPSEAAILLRKPIE